MNKSNETYRVGQRFYINKEEYILSQVGCSMVCLVGLEDGNRYEEPIFVKDIFKITNKEMFSCSANIPFQEFKNLNK